MLTGSTANAVDMQTSWVVNHLNRLQNNGFYGKLIVEMKEGKTVLLRVEETLKPPGVRER